jgi:hypothetical protein
MAKRTRKKSSETSGQPSDEATQVITAESAAPAPPKRARKIAKPAKNAPIGDDIPTAPNRANVSNASTPSYGDSAFFTPPPNVRSYPTEIQEAIRLRAYQLFLERGAEHGHDFEDWLRAETEVLARLGERTA